MEDVVKPGAGEAPTPLAGSLLQAAYGDWNALLERLPVGVYVCDGLGVVTHYNRRAAELWGRAPEPRDPAIRYCGSLRLHLPDGEPLPHEACPVVAVLATGEPARDLQVVVERPDGSRIDVLANVEPLLDAAGRVIGAVNCFQDVSGLKRAQREVQQRDAWIREVAAHSPVAIYWTDAKGRIASFNKAAAAMWGRAPVLGVDRWCGSHKLFHPDGRPMPLDDCPMAKALLTGQVGGPNEGVYERPDGTRGAFLAYPTLLRDRDSAMVGAVNMLVDISDRKAAEERQKLLLDELNHRVKNTLATVQSLAAHSLRGDGDPQQMRQDFEARLLALSNAHNELADRRWEDAELAVLAREVLAPYGSARLRLEGGPVTVPARTAVTLSMVLHELATNAAKYGALSAPEGRLTVRWKAEEEAGGRRLVLDWEEAGGPPVAPPSRRGFGTRFVDGAIRGELGGTIDLAFAPGGVRCRIEAPL